MIIIWSGAGILTPVIFVAAVMGTLIGFESIGVKGGWVIMLGMWLAAAVNFGLGKALEGGESSHSFFFIPVKAWSVLMVILSFLVLFVK